MKEGRANTHAVSLRETTVVIENAHREGSDGGVGGRVKRDQVTKTTDTGDAVQAQVGVRCWRKGVAVWKQRS